MAHAPGPWHVDDRSEDLEWIYVRSSDGACIHSECSDKRTTQYETDIANANLIAAAPELLAELKHLVRHMEPVEESGLNIPGLATLNGARSAIIKAEGRS